MTMSEFIRANTWQIDQVILSRVSGLKLNNHERQQWILNDEGLYLWARQSGVKI